ncbi:MAG: ankyrin repeat domain-containing protein [Candidatus Riflebacteria bacterium]
MPGFKTSLAFLLVVFVFSLPVMPAKAQLHSAFLPQRESAIRDHCFALQRVLQGAIEMYNMDQSEGISSIEERTLQNPGPLIPEYMRSLDIQNGCSLISSGDLMVDGYVLCKTHGASSKCDHAALETEDFKKAAQILIEGGARVDGPDANGDTALHVAVALEKPGIVEYLLTLKADYSLKNINGKNAIDLAIDNQDLDTAHILYDNGARPSNVQSREKEIFMPKPATCSGNISVIKNSQAGSLDVNATYSLPISFKTDADSRISFVLGRDESFYCNEETRMLEKILGNGLTIELLAESELLIGRPEFDRKVAIVTRQPMRLLNGEIRVSKLGTSEKIGTPVIVVGKHLKIKFDSAVCKIFYDAARDSGKIAVKSGAIEVVTKESPEEAVKITGFYMVIFENGKLGNVHQADVAKEFN